jgi:hypothetical protein
MDLLLFEIVIKGLLLDWKGQGPFIEDIMSGVDLNFKLHKLIWDLFGIKSTRLVNWT